MLIIRYRLETNENFESIKINGIIVFSMNLNVSLRQNYHGQKHIIQKMIIIYLLAIQIHMKV